MEKNFDEDKEDRDKIFNQFTVKKIRKIKGFQKISKKEARNIINTLIQLCWMYCDLYHSIENIDSDESDKKLAA